MNNRNILTVLLAGLIIISSSVFILDEREIAIKSRLGEIVKTYDEHGIFLFIPFLNIIKKYD